MSFECPTCLADAYDRVVVIRAGGARYETEFFFCLGCSTMFLEPECYTRAPQVRQRMQQRERPELAYKQSMRRQEFTSRFFENMAKRLKGGFSTPAQIAALREKWGR